MTVAKVKEQDGMTLAKVKKQDGMTLAKVKEQDGMMPLQSCCYATNIYYCE